jgi:hypothetical protein
MEHVRDKLSVSERRACRVLGQARSTQRRSAQVPDDEARLVARVTELASESQAGGADLVPGRPEGAEETAQARAFVCGAAQDPEARAILESSVDLGKKLGMSLVAEGVETQED